MAIGGITNQNSGAGSGSISRDMIRRGAVVPSKLGLDVRNATGGTLAVNTLVYVNGWNVANQRPTIAKADADVAGAGAIYIVKTAILNNRNGMVYRELKSAANLVTTGASAGDPVYLSTTAGDWTLTAPVAPSRIQTVGWVIVGSATVGQIEFDLQSNVPPSTAAVDIPAGTVDPAAMGLAVWNDTGGAMAANDLVYISGYNAANDKPTIAKADSDAAGKRAQYVCIGAIANAAAGRAYKTFTSAANLDTSTAGAAGDPVYLSTVAGGYVIAAPAAGVRKQIVGHVKVKDAAVGVVVFNTESTNDELFGTTELAAAAVTNTKMPAGVISADATGRALLADDVLTSAEVSASGAGGKFAAGAITTAGLAHLVADDAFSSVEVSTAGAGGKFAASAITTAGLAHLVADDAFTSVEVSTADAGGKFAAGAITAAGGLHLFAVDSIANAFLLQAIADGAFAADDTTRALFAANFLGATATGRALMQTGFFTEAKATDAFAAQAITGALIKNLAIANAQMAAGAALANLAAGSVTEDKLVVPDLDTLNVLRCAKFTYDFAVLGGAVSTIPLTGDALPAKAIIVDGLLEVLTIFTSAGAAACAIQTEAANDTIVSAVIAGAPWSATGRKEIVPVSAATAVKTTVARTPSIVITVADLTAGKCNLWVRYYLSD